MLSVLVIDDEIHILDAIRSTLLKYGYNVVIAENGTKGIQRFDNGFFNLVILDLCMPDIDGFSVLSHIRMSDKRNTPVIGISGTPKLLADGDFDATLAKPFKIRGLLNAVISLC